MTSFEKKLNEDELKDILNQMGKEFIEYMRNHFLGWAKKNKLQTKGFEDFLNSNLFEVL